MPAEPRVPPIGVVARIQSALVAAGLPCVVGGSGLLVSLGLAEVARDWDLVVDGERDAVARVLRALGLAAEAVPATPPFASEGLLRVDAGDHAVDVIAGFRIGTPEGVVTVPARAGATWRGLVMARREDWALAYAAMGRPERAALLAD